MAILMAFQSPELDILGLTTVFGNVNTEDATHNALLLVCPVVYSASLSFLGACLSTLCFGCVCDL